MDAAAGFRRLVREPVVAVVPLKSLDHAKGRLGADLGAADRRALTAWMLERVVAACRASRGVGETLVVAGDAQGAALARSLAVAVTVEPRPTLSAALATADRILAGAAESLVVTADLPLATAESLDEVFAAAPAGPAVVVARSSDGGTSALLRRPAGVIPTRFGPASARAHLELAARAGVRGVCLRVPALALDVDDLESLRAAAAELPVLAAWLRDPGLGLRAAAS